MGLDSLLPRPSHLELCRVEDEMLNQWEVMVSGHNGSNRGLESVIPMRSLLLKLKPLFLLH